MILLKVIVAIAISLIFLAILVYPDYIWEDFHDL